MTRCVPVIIATGTSVRLRVKVSRLWLACLLVLGCAAAFGADTTPPAATGSPEESKAQENLQGYLQIQEQLHATQLAIERNRQEANTAAVESTKAFAARLQSIESALSSQRAQELQALQTSNKVMLLVAGVFAALGLLAMLFMAFFQWRTISRLAEIAAALPASHLLGPGPAYAALGAGDGHVVTVGPAQQANQQLLGALEQLEKRIHQLEHIPHPHPEASSAAPDPHAALPAPSGNGDPPVETTPIALLLAKGQSLLNLDKAEEALACFDEVLALNANHSEALLKKGTALERLRKLDEAIACYDRAIAADRSLTVAYLYKGGLFNRMERFGEALACYEEALRTQENRRG